MSWRAEPARIRYKGGMRNLEINRPERPEAKGATRRRGNREIPARVGVERETAWKR
jgi:hypothetical protein